MIGLYYKCKVVSEEGKGVKNIHNITAYKHCIGILSLSLTSDSFVYEHTVKKFEPFHKTRTKLRYTRLSNTFPRSLIEHTQSVLRLQPLPEWGKWKKEEDHLNRDFHRVYCIAFIIIIISHLSFISGETKYGYVFIYVA